jgi:MarR family transcriptional regulator, 2-MHQ and catechol-resistance regulon repressor
VAGSQPPVVVRRQKPTPQQLAWRSILELETTLIPLFDERLASVGIDVQIYDVLLHTNEAGPEGIRMRNLAESVLISKSGLTSLVDRLEHRGLVARTPDPADRRATRIQFTPEGADVFRTAAAAHVADVEELFASRLTADEARRIHRVLSRIRHEIRG